MIKASTRISGRCAAALAVAAGVLGLAGGPLMAAETPDELIEVDWPHEGFFGAYDPAALQRGFQVYSNVCASCHSLDYIAFRNLASLGYTEDQVSAIASTFTVTDGPNDQGEMFERPATASDYFPSPYENEAAARVANGGAYPPDLSLITKARASGSDYLYSLLVGYEDPPPDVELQPGMYWNEYYAGHQIAMPPPLNEGVVEYQDGTEATVAQMSMDVTQFLNWAAEPTLEIRKQTGIKVILFLTVMTGVFYAYKRQIWADQH